MHAKEDKPEVNWDLENYETIEHPLVYQYEYDYETLVEESDPNYLDFVPNSAFQKGLQFQELSTLDCSKIPEASALKEIKTEGATDDEPCQAALAIAANIPTPDPKTLTNWRTFISTAYYHPNVLAHKDVECLKELFQLMGSDIYFENANFMIELETEYKVLVNLRPALPPAQPAPLLTFAHIKEFSVEVELKTCIVRKYAIMDYMKEAVSKLVNFIVEYPEALYLEVYGFVLDFLLRFGVREEVIIDAVMRTQSRRRKSQRPASVLILKQANMLGKGRKEFLQKLLLSSPDKKYDPVVPIVIEPSPVRHLRSRRTGVRVDNGTPKDLDLKPDMTSISSNDLCSIAVSALSSASTATKKGVKRKLFQCGRGVKDTSQPIHNSTYKRQRYKKTPGQLLARNKKRVYTRRDDSLLVKAFACAICKNRSFEYKGNLTVHMKKHHPESAKLPMTCTSSLQVTPYSCPVCMKGFGNIYRCKRHISAVHPDQADTDPLTIKLENAVEKGTKDRIKQPQNSNQPAVKNHVVHTPEVITTSATRCPSRTTRNSRNSSDFLELAMSAKELLNFHISNRSNCNIIGGLSLSPLAQQFRAPAVK